MPIPTTDRGRLAALTSLVAWQAVGGYTLPAAVLDAANVHTAAVGLPVLPPAPLRHLDTAAAQAVAALARGETPDPMKLAGAVTAGQAQADAVSAARRLVGIAAEQAAARAVAVAAEHATAIVVDILAPAYADTLDLARRQAPAVAGHPLDGGGWDAPPKARAARAKLHELTARHRALREARAAIVGLGGQEPAQDTAGQFMLLRRPQALAPDWTVGTSPMPRPAVPTDPTAALVWLVTTADPAQPWLPTIDQQDAAWHDVFGHAAKARGRAAVSARANAGAPV